MSYAVKEIFLTQQGEGANLGRTAVFIRLAGCNLWSGREKDRATAVCRFCDTDFIGGTRLEAEPLAAQAASLWPGAEHRFAVLTGGEPLLQADAALVDALHAEGFTVALETNGTIALPAPIDWVCVSPKAGATLALDRADELKLVYPQGGLPPEALAGFTARHRWLSPMDLPGRRAANTAAAAAFCRAHPAWRLAIQAQGLGYPMTVRRAASVPLEVAHRGLDGVMHGHSLIAEVWTGGDVDLDAWRKQVAIAAARIEGQLEHTIAARTFEDVAAALLAALPDADRIVIRLPTRGHAVEMRR